MRISKDPAERKKEIICAAEAIFWEKGFDETAVSDIVRRVGVAQGTFYYYFKSKDELLEGIIEKYLIMFEAEARAIAADDSIGTVEKIRMVIRKGFVMMKGREKFLDYLHRETNANLHKKYRDMINNRIIPIVIGIIKEGSEKGILKLAYPDETAEILFQMLVSMEDSYRQIFLSGQSDSPKFSRKLKAAEELVEKALGLDRGCLDGTLAWSV